PDAQRGQRSHPSGHQRGRRAITGIAATDTVIRLFDTLMKRNNCNHRKQYLAFNPLPAMRKALSAFLALSLSCVSAFSQCLIPKASGDTVFPVTGNYYT